MWKWLGAAAALFGVAGAADAAFVVTFTESGGDVIETGAGSLNTAPLFTDGTPVAAAAAVNPSTGFLIAGSPAVSTINLFAALLPAGSVVAFGSGGVASPDAGFGDTVAFVPVTADGVAVGVPIGYVSGSALSSLSTFTGQTFASLGLTAGTYSFDLLGAEGNFTDTFTIQVGPTSAVPEAATWAMMVAGFGAIGAGLRGRRRVSVGFG